MNCGITIGRIFGGALRRLSARMLFRCGFVFALSIALGYGNDSGTRQRFSVLARLRKLNLRDAGALNLPWPEPAARFV